MNKSKNSSFDKPNEYGFLLMLAGLALVSWLVARFYPKGKAQLPELRKRAEKLQREIETLEILQEQAKLDLRRVRIEQKALQQELSDALSTYAPGFEYKLPTQSGHEAGPA